MCVRQAADLSELWTAQAAEWEGEVQLLLVNDVGYEDGLEAFVAEHDLPVLQDTVEARATDTFHADKWYVYVIDRTQTLRRIHYHLNLPSESPRLVDAVNELLAEEAP